MSGGKILLVEDEADIALTVRLALELSGYEVGVASTAEDALEMWDALDPSVVLLDITLPGMDGWTFLSTLKADGRLTSVGVAVVSAHVSEEVSRRASAFGARYLTKPFEIEALLRMIVEVRGIAAEQA